MEDCFCGEMVRKESGSTLDILMDIISYYCAKRQDSKQHVPDWGQLYSEGVVYAIFRYYRRPDMKGLGRDASLARMAWEEFGLRNVVRLASGYSMIMGDGPRGRMDEKEIKKILDRHKPEIMAAIESGLDISARF